MGERQKLNGEREQRTCIGLEEEGADQVKSVQSKLFEKVRAFFTLVSPTRVQSPDFTMRCDAKGTVSVVTSNQYTISIHTSPRHTYRIPVSQQTTAV